MLKKLKNEIILFNKINNNGVADKNFNSYIIIIIH